jgi:hypothetical protein
MIRNANLIKTASYFESKQNAMRQIGEGVGTVPYMRETTTTTTERIIYNTHENEDSSDRGIGFIPSITYFRFTTPPDAHR